MLDNVKFSTPQIMVLTYFKSIRHAPAYFKFPQKKPVKHIPAVHSRYTSPDNLARFFSDEFGVSFETVASFLKECRSSALEEEEG